MKFLGQLFPSLKSRWKYSKEKAEAPQELTDVARRSNSNSVHYKITSVYPKKTVALAKIGVIFLALLWFRDYRASTGSAQPAGSVWCTRMVRARGALGECI
jgi:hypothetical protein